MECAFLRGVAMGSLLNTLSRLHDLNWCIRASWNTDAMRGKLRQRNREDDDAPEEKQGTIGAHDDDKPDAVGTVIASH